MPVSVPFCLLLQLKCPTKQLLRVLSVLLMLKFSTQKSQEQFSSQFQSDFLHTPHTRKYFSTQRSPNLVELQAGQLKGTLVTLPPITGVQLSQVEVFKGIQYASLIQGELRFMPPTSYLEKWDGVRAFHHHKPACPQKLASDEELLKQMPRSRMEFLKRLNEKSRHQGEECLNLNLYVPFKGACCCVIFGSLAFFITSTKNFCCFLYQKFID